ncbi:hypothetical protein J6590_091199 [Homalodisca vitripennis]|nr:hypothetical protein J6590_091199 [Homalodisca vitripennis]
MDIPGLSRETSDTFYSSGYPGLIYGNFTHLLQLCISRGCLGDSSSNTFYSYGYPGVVWETPLQTPSTALDIPGLSTETSHTFYSSGYPRVVYGNFTHLLQLWISRGCLRKLHTPSTARGNFRHLLQLWISRGCLRKLHTPSTALDIPGLSRETSDTFYSYGYPGVVWETPLQTPSTATNIQGLSGRLLFKHLLQLWISRGCLGKLHTPSTALDIPGLSTETSHTFYSSGRLVRGGHTRPALITARVHPGMVHQSQKSRNPINPVKGRSTKSPSRAMDIPGLSGRLLFKHLLQLWISRGCLGNSSSHTFYSSGYPGVVYGNFTHLLQLGYGYPGVVWETPLQTPSTAMDIPGLSRRLFKHLLQLWISRGCLGKLQTPSTALDIPGLSTETSHTFYSSGYPGVVYGNFTHLLQLGYGYPGVVWETPLQTPSTAMDIPGLSGRLLFKHLLQLWISRGYLGKLQTPSTALDIPGLSTETSHTFYSSGYPGLIYGNFTHLLQLWISRGCLGDSSSNTFYSYEYPGVVWETPLQTPSTALDIPGLSRETSDTFYSSGYPGVVYGNFTHLLQLGYGYPGVVWETPLQTPSTALNIPGLSRETSDTFYSSGYPGVVYGNFTHLLQLWISRGCLRKLQTPSTALDIPGLSTETSHTFYSSGRLVRGGQTRPALITARVHPGMVQQAQKSRNPINPDKEGFLRIFNDYDLMIIYSYGYPGVVWETPLQTPSTAMDIPGLSRETSDTFYSSGYPGVVYGNFRHLLQLWISRVCLRKLHTPSTARVGWSAVVEPGQH